MKYIFFLLLISKIAFCQTNSENGWEKIIITRNSDDIRGLTRIAEVTADAKKLYGNQSKLREEATIKLKKEAAKKGATIILIQVDNFSMAPINNISLVGVAYSNKNTAILNSNISVPTKPNITEQSIPKNTNSIADELLKYKQLVDSGFMTKEEFDVQKKRLLNQNNTSNVPVLTVSASEKVEKTTNSTEVEKLDGDFEIGSIVTWKDFSDDIWYGEISKLKDNLATIKTSNHGYDLTKSINIKELTKIKSMPYLDTSKYKKETIIGNINSGDKIELSAKLEKVFGIYIGIRGSEDNIILGIQSSNKGKPTINEFALKDYTIIKSKEKK